MHPKPALLHWPRSGQPFLSRFDGTEMCDYLATCPFRVEALNGHSTHDQREPKGCHNLQASRVVKVCLLLTRVEKIVMFYRSVYSFYFQPLCYTGDGMMFARTAWQPVSIISHWWFAASCGPALRMVAAAPALAAAAALLPCECSTSFQGKS